MIDFKFRQLHLNSQCFKLKKKNDQMYIVHVFTWRSHYLHLQTATII